MIGKKDKMERNNKKRLLAFIPYLALTALAVLGIINIKWLINVLAGLWNILSPLVIGCAMAYVLNLIMRKLEKLYFPKSEKRIVQATKRPVCLVLSLLLVFILLGLVIGLIVPEIVNIFVVMGETLPVYGEKIRKLLMEYDSQLPVVGDYIEEYLQNGGIDWNTILAKAVEFAKNGVGGLLTSTISVVASVVGGVVNFFIGLIFAIYILYNKEKLASQMSRLMKSYMKPENSARLTYFCSTADKCFSSFIVGQCTEAVILGVLCALGMAILRIPYASTIGTLIGATALIPIVGAYIGAIVGALMILVVDPIKALWFVIFLVILQQVEGNVIYPKVVGSSIGLPGMWVLAAVTVGGGLGGIPGMLFGVPAAATVYKLLQNDVRRRERTAAEEDHEADEAPQAEDNTENEQSGSQTDSQSDNSSVT